MGLHISDRATPKQEVLLTDLGYLKSSTNWPLTQEQAAEIIDGLLENKKHDEANDRLNYGPLELSDDPFDNSNKWHKYKENQS